MSGTEQHQRMTRERSESGRYVETVTLEDVFDTFDKVRGPVITSSDVSEALDCTTEAARQKLNKLHERGDVDRRKTGRTVVWWRTPDATEGRERGVTPPDAHTVDTTTEGETPSARTPGARDDDAGSRASSDAPETAPIETDQDLVDALRDWFEEGDHPPKTAHARDAVIDVFTLLREHGTLSTGELKERVYERHSEHYADAKPMWDSFSPYLTDVPGIEKAGYGEFGYAGDDATRDALKDD